ncbi:hypothetical protein [Miltoncostaea marina]|uniref:hypothetical protein n=1 Tax=Miltoncostaea marina TaxID=2843215 RepID=UPI001C3E2709|nr:hypothetical protein [Miltoncostaea marina]
MGSRARLIAGILLAAALLAAALYLLLDDEGTHPPPREDAGALVAPRPAGGYGVADTSA